NHPAQDGGRRGAGAAGGALLSHRPSGAGDRVRLAASARSPQEPAGGRGRRRHRHLGAGPAGRARPSPLPRPPLRRRPGGRARLQLTGLESRLEAPRPPPRPPAPPPAAAAAPRPGPGPAMGDAGSERSKAPSLPPRCPCGFWGSSKTMNLCSKCFAGKCNKRLYGFCWVIETTLLVSPAGSLHGFFSLCVIGFSSLWFFIICQSRTLV
uniref:A20-type domain-containing protein n=1 Tax=Pavo cristatus TaxID=9049 RepID=A0A8C9ESJ2_PAVCR